ncbi:MAG: aminomethyl-transferring glycine dehydrogenase [Lysobacterales bacterium]
MTDQRNPDTYSPLARLETDGEFIRRHIGPDDKDIAHMLEVVGATSLEALTEETLPEAILDKTPLDLRPAAGEREVLQELKQIADKNKVMHSMIGTGYHETITPTVILRNILENPGWYTAYTPYQAEISQGRLEAMLNFQQMVSDLTGMDLANASLLDEATAAAEAMAQLHRVNRKSKSKRFLVDVDCLPQTIDVVETRARHFGFEIVIADPESGLEDGEYFGALIQYPGSSGTVRDWEHFVAKAHEAGTRVAVAADLLSLALLKPPGEMGADIVLGSAQRFGVPMGYGGPHAAFYATRDEFKRSLPGRVIGVSRDRHGFPALRMALQTREQHIRRDKATSNICTAQALLAVMAGMYGVYHGPAGISKIARRVHRLTAILNAGLNQLGAATHNAGYFDTLTIHCPGRATGIVERAADSGINLFRQDDDHVRLSVNEKTTRAHIRSIWSAAADGAELPNLEQLDRELGETHSDIPQALRRDSAFMEHEVFNSFHSETEMLRYLKRLENKDLSLAHAMISLGSCTMKLNATTEMIPVTWPQFGDIHPFAPAEQAGGYHQLIKELEDMLCACTGYDAVSLQPNAGSQGEYGGLLAIKEYHHARGDDQRDICLIPSSAHGTNPASAAMAGMKIKVVACDEQGNVDLADLEAKAEQFSETLSALMITYPSTHGVFEEQVRDICEIIHKHGGQVYLDGANLNALVGCAGPGNFGADVSHLNLHKTFCIPHGGGGPGVGPLCVREHLAPYLPGHKLVNMGGQHAGNGALSAAPWGSAGILPISWTYIRMMGPNGMLKATQVAILNANYIATRLADAFPVLYTGRNGHVAHECIIDLRPFKQSSGVSEEDVAKRLIDYGFHSPTMSFPVPGTLMIEPTESESLEELDRFCDAMLSIRKEIDAVESGDWPAGDNPLCNAPHNARDLVGQWDHPYSAEQAAFPDSGLWRGKFWPAVTRVDNVFGDRHLVCSCPPMEAWLEEAETD